jgi:hypothetical protein
MVMCCGLIVKSLPFRKMGATQEEEFSGIGKLVPK